MGVRERQKPSLLLVVAEGCQGVLLPRVHDSIFFCFEEKKMSRLFFSVTVIVFPYG